MYGRRRLVEYTVQHKNILYTINEQIDWTLDVLNHADCERY